MYSKGIKRTLITLFVASFAGMAWGQDIIGSTSNDSIKSQPWHKNYLRRVSKFEGGYHASDDMHGFGFSISLKGNIIGFDIHRGDKFSPIICNKEWSIYTSREILFYPIKKYVYLSGRGSLGFTHVSIKNESQYSDQNISNGHFVFALEPRVGFVFKHIGCSGGYHWGWGTDHYRTNYWFVNGSFEF